jgi:hypothetical protein
MSLSTPARKNRVLGTPVRDMGHTVAQNAEIARSGDPMLDNT